MCMGIAQPAIAAGYDTRMYDVSEAAVARGRGAIEQIVKKGVELGKVAGGDADAMVTRLPQTHSLEEALAGAPFVIEAAPERLDLKLALFADIERLRRAATGDAVKPSRSTRTL